MTDSDEQAAEALTDTPENHRHHEYQRQRDGVLKGGAEHQGHEPPDVGLHDERDEESQGDAHPAGQDQRRGIGSSCRPAQEDSLQRGEQGHRNLRRCHGHGIDAEVAGTDQADEEQLVQSATDG